MLGRDVEQIIRDLIEIAIAIIKEKKRKEVEAKSQLSSEERVLDTLVGKNATHATRESFRKRLRAGDLDNTIIEIAVNDSGSQPSFEIPGMQGGVGMVNIADILGKGMGGKKKKKKMTVKESHEILINEETAQKNLIKLSKKQNFLLKITVLFFLTRSTKSQLEANDQGQMYLERASSVIYCH